MNDPIVEDAENEVGDEVEGHGRIRILDAKPVVDDADGHRYVPVDERPPVGEVPKQTDSDGD